MPRIPAPLYSLLILLIPIIIIVVTVNLKSAGGGDNDTQGWYSPPNQERGAWDILWSCLSTVFICTWTVIHPDIPRKSAKGFFEYLIDHRLPWLALAILAPELVTIIAMGQFLSAWGKADRTAASTALLSSPSPTAAAGQVHRHHTLPEKPSMTQNFYTIMGGYVFHCAPQAASRGEHEAIILDLDQVSVLYDHKDQHLLKNEELWDRSKSDNVGKSIALLQALWLVIQVISRAVEHLPTSTLELTSVAFVSCTFFTSIFWWKKPLDTRIPTKIRSEQVDAEVVGDILLLEGMKTTRNSADPKVSGWQSEVIQGILEPIQQSAYHRPRSLWLRFTNTALLSAIFGGIHCVAISWSFPSLTENIMWIVASLFTATLPTATLLLFYAPLQAEVVSRTSQQFRKCVIVALCTMYVAARLYLIFEPFLALRSMPVGVYRKVQWTSYIPHIN